LKDIGKLIEGVRSRRGLSRGELARHLGVTVQTILNLERDPNYNLGVRLMRQIEVALRGEFQITFTEAEDMNDRIRLGNDELILYVRKNHDCALTNDQLGRRIWGWLRENASGEKLEENQPCRWGAVGGFIGERALPKTATQFEFRASALPDLYQFLNQLGQEQAAPAVAGGPASIPLASYRVGECALVLDLLGTAVRMTDLGNWFEPLRESLDLVVDALDTTTNIAAPERSARVFQHGDTLVIPADDPAKLVPLGKLLLTTCWNRDVLAQAAIAAGGVYFITDPSGFGTRKLLQPNAVLQVLVGPAVARGHHALRGVRGPRLMLDEETVHVSPTSGVWRRYLGAAKHQVTPGAGIQVSEVAWWEDLLDLDEEVARRTKIVEARISDAEEQASGSPVKLLWERDTASLRKRLDHLAALAQVLADDPF